MRLLRVLPLLLLAGCRQDTPQPWQLVIHAPTNVRTTTLFVLPPDNTVELHDARGDVAYQMPAQPSRIEVIRHGDPGSLRVELWHNGELDSAAPCDGPMEFVRIENHPKPLPKGAKGI